MEDANFRGELLGFVANLQQPYGYERSFKLSDGQLYQDRFLVTLHVDAFNGSASANLNELALALRMPNKLKSEISKELSGVQVVHLGYERQQATTVCKFYFEQPFCHGANSRQLVHRALKWDVFSAKSAVTEYFFLPSLSKENMLTRIASICDRGADHPIVECVSQLLDLACEHAPIEDLFFLEVEEKGNPRRSFDIRFYDAGVTVGQIGTVLESAAQLVNAPMDALKELIALDFERPLGHMSAGISREGKEFVSFYYGVESR